MAKVLILTMIGAIYFYYKNPTLHSKCIYTYTISLVKTINNNRNTKNNIKVFHKGTVDLNSVKFET